MDASGFSRIAEEAVRDETLGPERLAQMLQRRFEPMVRRCRDHGGSIVCFPGDAALVVFPATSDDAHPERRAIAAAEGLLVDAESLANPMLRCGIASGAIEILELARPNEHPRVLVRGPATREAFRLHAEARPGELRVAADPSDRGPSTKRADDRADAHALPRFEQSDSLAHLAWLDPESVAELRRVTTVFVRVGDWSTAGTAPIASLERAMNAVADAFESTGGAIVQALFDEGGLTVMACFGLPGSTYEDDVPRALDASRAVERALVRLGFSPSIGVSTGRTFAGIRGAEDRREYAPIGHSVNLAARLMQLGEPGILVDESTAALSSSRWRASPAGARRLPKLEHALDVFTISELADEPRLESTIHGRGFERAQIEDAIAAIGVRPNGPRIGFLAPPGMGKSVLARFTAERAKARGVRVVAIAGRERGSDAPEISLATLFRDDPDASPEAQVASRLARIPHVVDWVPAFLGVLDPRAHESDLTRQMDPEQRHNAARRVFAALLQSFCDEGPCVLLVDDAHGLDEATEDLLLHALRTVPPLAAFFFGRPEESTRGLWSTRAEIASLAVQPLRGLDREAVESLVHEILGGNGPGDRLLESVVTRCEGNPLFVRHIALSLRDSQRPPAPRTEDRPLGESEGHVSVPPTVEATIAARLDRLPVESRNLVKLASVLGRDFDEEILVALDGAATHDPESVLAHLASRGIIVRDVRRGRARFEHAMTREVAYGLLLGSHRRALHGRAADLLGHDRSVLALRAYHRVGSDSPWKGIADLDALGREALRRFANFEAYEYLKEADRLETLYEDEIEADRHGAALRRAERAAAIAEAAHKTGRHEDAMEHGARVGVSFGLSLPTRTLPKATTAGRAIVTHVIARRRGHATTNHAASLDPTALEAVASAYYWASLSAFNHNHVGSYVLFNVLTLNVTEGRPSLRERAYALSVMGITAGLFGMRSEAARYGADAIALADSLGDDLSGAQVRMFDSIRLGALGDFDGVEAHCAPMVQVADRFGDLRLAAELRSLRALAATHRGRLDDASHLWREVLGIANESGDPMVENWSRCGLVEVELRRDADPDEALCRSELERARAASRALGVEESVRAIGLEAWLGGRFAEPAKAAALIRIALDALDSVPMPNAFWSLDGMSGPMLGLLELRRRDERAFDDDSVRALVARAATPIERYARVFPLGRPRAALAAAVVASTRKPRWLARVLESRAATAIAESKLALEARLAEDLGLSARR